MTADERRRIHALAAEGLSARAIARAVSSSHPTIAKVLAEPAPPPAIDPEHMRPPITPEAPDDGAPALQVVRELLAEARHQFAISTSLGDSGAAQRYARTAAGLTPVLARLEREFREDDGSIRVTAADIAAANERLNERLAAICARPLHCAECSRALSVSWGMGDEQHQDPNVNARAR